MSSMKQTIRKLSISFLYKNDPSSCIEPFYFVNNKTLMLAERTDYRARNLAPDSVLCLL